VPKDQTVAQLLSEANAIFTKAKADLATSCTAGNCDFNTYFNAVNLYAAYVAQANLQESGSASTTTTTATSS
jgi:hypothetical protein